MMKRLVVAILLGLVGQATSYGEGFFYALDGVREDDRLYRLDIDENFEVTVTPIGLPGGLGFPEVAGLVWDRTHERLFGYDQLLDVWLEINPTTGVATALGPFTLDVNDMTYNPNDGMVYAIFFTTIFSIDPDTGAWSEVIVDSINCGVAHVFDTTGGFDGLFTRSPIGLRLFTEPAWESVNLLGDVSCGRAMMWDPNSDTLWNFSSSKLYEVHQVTGNQTLVADWEFSSGPLTGIHSVTFVPDEPDPPLVCGAMDADNDGDIDLVDFGTFQQCFTGPSPQWAK